MFPIKPHMVFTAQHITTVYRKLLTNWGKCRYGVIPLGLTVGKTKYIQFHQSIQSNCPHFADHINLATNKQVRKISMASAQALAGAVPQSYDYFLVLDFEATCERGQKIDPQEIIELPVLKVNGKTFETEAIFHQYVQPMVHRELTSFCTELTGIVQDMVDGQPDIKETLKSLDAWMASEGLLNKETKSIFVTCGDWDLKTMLPGQCRYFNIKPAGYFSQWINIKRSFCDVMGDWPKGMMPMLEKLGIKHEGRHHSGIDDCKNIAKILKGLASKGYVFKATGHIQR